MNISPIEEVKRNICGYKVQQFQGPVKRYCQTMDLKDDPELIKEYIQCHSKDKAWPERRNQCCRYSGNGDLYIRFPCIYDC